MTTPRRPQRDPKRNPATDWAFIEILLRSPSVRTAFIHGPPGCGKTYACQHIGLRGSFYSLSLTEETPAAEIRGHYLPKGKEMAWHDGPAIRALREGARLVVNELSHGSADVLSMLHPLLENPDTACLTLPTGETVRPAPGFQLFASDNLPPEDLPPALRDRFDCVIEVREPHPSALERLEEGLREIARRSMALEPDRRLSIRGWLSVQNLTGELGLEGALWAVFGAARGAQIHDSIILGRAQN